jgi:acetyl esterase/lipase
MATTNKPVLEPTTQAFIDALAAQGGKPLYTLSYADARKLLEDVQAIDVKKLPADIEEKVFPVGPTGEVSVRIYRPAGAKGPLPAVMYFHGGGWILGSKNTHDRLLRDLVNGANAAFVFVNYTPSPEAQFPVPVEQCYAATKYVAENGQALGLDSSRLALAGDSVGGYTTAVVAQLAKERNGPSIRYQVMLYPVTDSSMSQPSYKEFENGPWLTAAAMAWFWDAYAPNKKDRTVCQEAHSGRCSSNAAEGSRYPSRLRVTKPLGPNPGNQSNGTDCLGEALGSISHKEPCNGDSGCLKTCRDPGPPRMIHRFGPGRAPIVCTRHRVFIVFQPNARPTFGANRASSQSSAH